MDTFTSDDGQLRELALFAGAGGGILGGKLLGWTDLKPLGTGRFLTQWLSHGKRSEVA